MKKILLLVLLSATVSHAQTMFGYMDFNRFFRAYVNGYFSQIEHQEVSNVTLNDEFIVYQNSQKDFKVFDGTKTKLLTNQMVEYKSSDHLLAWNIQRLLFYYEDGVPHNITSFGGDYAVSDSLIVYQDTRYYTLNCIYQGKVIQLMQQTADMYMPDLMVDNMVVFRDNGNVYKIFWRGQIYELGVYNGFGKFQFFASCDVLAFNDPQTQTFAIFENGAFTDLEEMQAKKAKAGRGFIVYEDNQGNLKLYKNGKIEMLASFFQNWDVKDDMFFWVESNITYTLENGVKKVIVNYPIQDWKMKNDVLAFKTNINGIAAYVNGKTKEISNFNNSEYFINGHGVLLTLPNSSVIVYENNTIYND